LEETDQAAQIQILEFLKNKDPEKTAALRKLILHSGQRDPAIITCDGFLINGNRRMMVLKGLVDEGHSSDFNMMKVVILPSDKDHGQGGAPTELEIEQIENRYQLQEEGKAEYYGFDRAISIRRKIAFGYSLEAQLKDNPQYANLPDAEFKKEVQNYRDEYLTPLDCVEEYLQQYRRPSQYHLISTGASDSSGRWQAFKDYSKVRKALFENAGARVKHGIEEDEIGDLQEAAFHIIRLRNLPSLNKKLHSIMRDLGKIFKNKVARQEIKKLSEQVDSFLPQEELKNEKGEFLSRDEIDEKWNAKNQQTIIRQVSRAILLNENATQSETPLELLKAALNKLEHEKMKVEHIRLQDYDDARRYAADIQAKARGIEREIYQHIKGRDELTKKKT
ncbi:hypothetical protein EBR43_12890, partial [bacterium]|nr:hypothetical protein [bacterium]